MGENRLMNTGPITYFKWQEVIFCFGVGGIALLHIAVRVGYGFLCTVMNDDMQKNAVIYSTGLEVLTCEPIGTCVYNTCTERTCSITVLIHPLNIPVL